MADWRVGQAVTGTDLNTLLENGTVMVFVQSSAPTGWTRLTDSALYNDRLVRVVSGALGPTGGSWTISGLTAPHTHGVSTLNVDTGAANEGRFDSTSNNTQAISSDGSWRPLYVDVIVCQRSETNWSNTDILTAAKLNTVLPSGTQIVVDQDVAPAGWTRNTTYNDRVIRLTTGVPGTGGSWTISGLSFAHDHAINSSANDITNSVIDAVSPLISASPTGSASPAVSSDGSWRPAVRDVIHVTRTEPDAATGAVLKTRHLNTIAPAGTRAVFLQGTTPTGWTRDTSISDRVLRLVSGTRAPNTGSWTVSGLSIASHSHSVTKVGRQTGGTPRGSSINNATASVSSDGSWRPAHHDAQIASRVGV